MYNQMVFDKEDINLMIEAIKDYASHSRFLKDYNQGTFHCLIFTDTQDIEQLDYLAQYLPHVILMSQLGQIWGLSYMNYKITIEIFVYIQL